MQFLHAGFGFWRFFMHEPILSPDERRELVQNIKRTVLDRMVLQRFGLSESEAEQLGEFEESSLTDEEKNELVEAFVADACRDPSVFRKGAQS